MTDGDKIAAATMAAEASRQKSGLVPQGMRAGYDIAGSILSYYQHFLQEMQKLPKS